MEKESSKREQGLEPKELWLLEVKQKRNGWQEKMKRESPGEDDVREANGIEFQEIGETPIAQLGGMLLQSSWHSPRCFFGRAKIILWVEGWME